MHSLFFQKLSQTPEQVIGNQISTSKNENQSDNENLKRNANARRLSESNSDNDHRSQSKEKDVFTDDAKVIPVKYIKTDTFEREAESLLVIFLYVKNVNKDNICVKYGENNVTTRFSTG